MEDMFLSKENRVFNKINERRNEADARDIIKEIERLATFDGNKRYRWIWELLQNARDEAGDGAQVVCGLRNDKFVFEHNGRPFLTDNLIALTLRTSTKPLTGSSGNAGKFGTGFVTSHLLSKIVTIEGVHSNEDGSRRFTYCLDRSMVDLEGMKRSLEISIRNITDIDLLLPSPVDNYWNSFEYPIAGPGIEIAMGGINQLEYNIAFALYVNRHLIKDVKIIGYGPDRLLSIGIHDSGINGITFLQLVENDDLGSKRGLLLQESSGLIIASPVIRDGGSYYLQPLEEVARLFKELPLIGTENFVIPNIIQHKDFLPTEERDGVRTRRSSESMEEIDLIADQNRGAFSDYIASFPNFLSALVEGEVRNLHFLAQTTMHLGAEKYYGLSWITDNVQMKLRECLKKQRLVVNAEGQPIFISDAYFPNCDCDYLDIFYDLLSGLFPKRLPDKNSYRHWYFIIMAQPEHWPENILVSVDDLVTELISSEILLKQLGSVDIVLSWLQGLVGYLESVKSERLGKDFAIYPNQIGQLCKQDELFHEVNLPVEFKAISQMLNNDLQKQLLPAGFRAKFVQDFNFKQFLESLNDTIGKLTVESASDEQIGAIFSICCLFEGNKAPRREEWYDLILELLPDLTKPRTDLLFVEKYNWDSAERWALKYVSSLIQNSIDLKAFDEIYFKNEQVALGWLNRFLIYAFRSEETKVAFDYSIILTADNKFKKISDQIRRLDDPTAYSQEIKDLYQLCSMEIDPSMYLLHRSLSHEQFTICELKYLTVPIDELFIQKNIEDQVKDQGPLHKLFVFLKTLTESDKWAVVFPHFMAKLPIFYITVLGRGSGFSRLLRIKKPIEEIEKLDSLSLTADQLKQLDDAAKVIGNPQSLLEKAQQLADAAEEIRWRQQVGLAAEKAFREALGEALPSFIAMDNPDVGGDFVITLAGKDYSIEIKSAIEQKESIKMSLIQGEEASRRADRYALCVISRPAGTLTDKDQFKRNAKFVTDIGYLVGSKVEDWRRGLAEIEVDEQVSVLLDNKSGFVNVRKSIWTNGVNFNDFVLLLKQYFELD